MNTGLNPGPTNRPDFLDVILFLLSLSARTIREKAIPGMFTGPTGQSKQTTSIARRIQVVHRESKTFRTVGWNPGRPNRPDFDEIQLAVQVRTIRRKSKVRAYSPERPANRSKPLPLPGDTGPFILSLKPVKAIPPALSTQGSPSTSMKMSAGGRPCP